MGQKVNPIGMRLQVNRTWDSRWYAYTKDCLLYTSPSPRDISGSRMPSSA